MPSFLERIKARKFASAASTAVDIGVDGDTQARLLFDAGGKITWGNGASVGDVNLYRSAANVLETDDTFKSPSLFVDSIEIDTTGASTGDVLTFDGTKFLASSASTSLVANLGDLGDVIITAPEEFQTLEYDGTNWVNKHSSVVSYVRNAETTTLTTGTVVYLFGATGDHATVKRADKASDATSSKTVGLIGANIAASQNGPVITRGYVDGINLSVGYSPGDILWLGSNGAFTKTKATAPDHLVFVGVVVRATNNGIVYVATQNGYELDELHNVAASSPNPGDFLKYNGSLWVNDPINLGTDTVGNYVSSITAGTGISVNFTPGEDAGASVSLNATLDQLSDVSTAGAVVGDVIKFNGSSWTAASVAAGGASVTVSTTAPASPSEGDMWFESDTGRTYVYYDSYWVEVGAVSAGSRLVVGSNPPNNPTVGDMWFDSDTTKTYVYYDSTWVEIGGAGGGGGSSVTVSSSAPASPSEGDMWFDSDTAQTFIYYDSQWIEIGASAMAATVSTSAPNSPIAGQIWFDSDTGGAYVYYDGNWVEIGAAPQITSSDVTTALGYTPANASTAATTGKAIAMAIVFGG